MYKGVFCGYSTLSESVINGNRIRCRKINSDSNFFVNNATGTQIEYGGYTVAMTASAQIIPNQIYHLDIAIADAGDPNFDSAIFIDSIYSIPSSFVTKLNTYNSSTSIEVFPNPTNSFFYIKNAKLGSTYFLSDLFGNILIEDRMDATSKIVDITKLSKGIYVLSVREKEYVFNKKIIVD